MPNLLTTVIHRYLYEDLLDMNFFFFFIKNHRKWTFEVNTNNNMYFAHVMRILSYNTLHVIRRHHILCTISMGGGTGGRGVGPPLEIEIYLVKFLKI